MTATSDALQRLGDLVAKRRAELRLQVRPAARSAGITNTTWKRVEDGLPVRDITYAHIEAALGWEIGSCKGVLAGGEPALASEGTAETAAPDGEPTLLSSSGQVEEWSPIVAADLKDAVRDAVMGTMPGATGREIQEIEAAVEEALRRRLAMRRGTSS